MRKIVEIWKEAPIKEYKKLYDISSIGRVYSKRKKRILKPSFVREYARIGLVSKKHNRKTFLINRLVLITFKRFPKKREECIHLDNKPFHNNLTNLKWGSHKENMFMDRGNNHSFKGDKNPNSKLTSKDIKKIRNIYKNRNSFFWGKRKLAKQFNIGETQLANIVRKKIGGWKNE